MGIEESREGGREKQGGRKGGRSREGGWEGEERQRRKEQIKIQGHEQVKGIL